jgi:hypothetical protein
LINGGSDVFSRAPYGGRLAKSQLAH